MDPSSILLTDKVAIVTGGGDGIGKGIALTFARFGADVVIADKIAKRGDAVAEEVCSLGRKGVAITTDIRDYDQVTALVERTVSDLGGVDILVNNAGGTRYAQFMELGGPLAWKKHIDLNFNGLFGPTELAVQAMIAGGRKGSIINISSIEGLRAAPNFSVYAACKAGMINFTRTLALELADHGIRINAIAPDVIDTPHTAEFGAQADPSPDRFRGIPMRRQGSVDEVAGACVFLASEMASYITGTTMSVDGGTAASSGWVRSEAGAWTNLP